MRARLALCLLAVAGVAAAQPDVPRLLAPSTLPPALYSHPVLVFGSVLPLPVMPDLARADCQPQPLARGAIDWRALSPYQPLYAPQTAPPQRYWLGW